MENKELEKIATHPLVILGNAIQSREPVVLATLVQSDGASPAKPGAQMVLLANDTFIGTIGGGKIEEIVLFEMKIARHDGTVLLKHFELTEKGEDSVGMLCGGDVNVFIQSYLPPAQIIIVGGGHIGKPLGTMAEMAGFEVITVDLNADKADVLDLSHLNIGENSFIVLVTADHITDEKMLRISLSTKASYIGMIGSLAKCKTIINHLKIDGFNDNDFIKVYAPIGLDLGGTKPEEIAVAILAEIMAVKYHKREKIQSVKTRHL